MVSLAMPSRAGRSALDGLGIHRPLPQEKSAHGIYSEFSSHTGLGDVVMATYLMFGTLTQAARKAISAKRTDDAVAPQKPRSS
jgi:hypothetical protein